MQTALHFLLIADSDGDVETILKVRPEAGLQIHVERVRNAGELEEALRGRSWDAILADLHGSGFTALGAWKSVQALAPRTPFLVTTDSIDDNALPELWRSGVRDFLSKDRLSRLSALFARPDGPSLVRVIPPEPQDEELNFFLRKFFETTRDFAVLFMNPSGDVVFWNSGARRAFGYAESEIKGRSAGLLYTSEDQKRDLLPRELSRAKSETHVEEERWYQRKNGSKFWGAGVLSALYGETGELRGFVHVLRDGTNKKMTMEQVEEARKKAESANKSKTQFLANMSHEIRTPLGIMMGFAELMAESDHSPVELKGFAETILKNGQTLSRMINDVLDVSKVEANKLETEKSDFSLSEFLADVLAMLRMQAEEKGLELVVTTEGPVPRRIYSDPTRLRQILMNLVGNSLKFTDAGMVELRVRSVSSPQTHSSMILEFEVKDTGQGIAADDVAKLFQPFASSEGADTRRLGGAGLGLYLSKRLAQALGGDLMLRETSENRGSTFVFTIDAGPFETDVKFYTERTAGPETSAEKALRGVRVLVVDDSPDNRLLVRRLLEHADAEVETAENGQEAVEKARDKEFDLILMDIQMPVMDGYEAFRQIRQGGFGKPIVALTAHAMHSEREHCFALGFDDHLSKPIDRKVLVETILRLTQKEFHGRPHLIPLHPSLH